MANPLKLLKLKPTGFQFIEELPIEASPKKVWSSLLKVEKWFRFDPDPKKASKHTFEATAGSRWLSTNWEGNTVCHGTVTYVEPGKLLRVEGQIGATHLPVTTVVIFELQPQAERNAQWQEQHERTLAGYAAHNAQVADALLQRSRNFDDQIEQVRGTVSLYDTQNGHGTAADANDAVDIFDKLYQASMDPNTTVRIPPKDVIDPLPGR
jgi:hypothetical protein